MGHLCVIGFLYLAEYLQYSYILDHTSEFEAKHVLMDLCVLRSWVYIHTYMFLWNPAFSSWFICVGEWWSHELGELLTEEHDEGSLFLGLLLDQGLNENSE